MRKALFFPILLWAVAPLNAQAVRSGFTGGGSLARADDIATTSAQPLGFNVNLFGSTFSGAYVSMNGYLTFDGPYTEFTPEPLSNNPRKIIAPFFSDVDTRNPNSGVVTWGRGTVNNRPAWAANYVRVGYFSSRADKLNSFQVVLIERADTGAGNFDIEFNYDSIQWEAGDEDGGVAGICGSECFPPTVGYSNGQSGSANVSFQLEGSRVPGAFLDSNPNGLRYRTRNSNVPGRLVFEVRAGVVQVLAVTSLNPSTAAAGSAGFTLTVNGSGFTSGSVVLWNGSPLSTTFVSASQLRATVTANLLAAPGTAQVTVAQAGGAPSNALPFSITGVAGPSITSVSPSSAQVGSGPLTIQVAGANFTTGSVVRWSVPAGSADLVTIYRSGILLEAIVPAALLASAGSAQISVVNPNGASSAAVPFVVTAPTVQEAVISGISPDSVAAGSPAFTLTVNGSRFVSNSVVWWNSLQLSTTYVNATQLRASVPANLVASPGTAQIMVLNPGVLPSNPVTLTITAVAAPSIATVTPNSAQAGSGALSIQVSGRNFVSGAVVRWNNTALNTTFLSATDLRAAVPASLLAAAGTAQITVANPTGAASNAVAFTILGAAAPVISSLSPDTARAGSGALELTVAGSNFASGAVVRWNGSPLSTTFVSATQLRAAVPASLLAAAGTAQVTAANPTGPASNALAFTITTAAAPTVSSISPNSAQAGSGALTIVVNGANFVNGSVVRWNGAPLSTTFVSASQLRAAVPANLLSAAGTAQVSVANPDGAASATLPFTVTAAPPPPPPSPNVQLQVTPPSSPTQPASVRLVFSEPASTEYQATVSLSFTPSAAGLPAGYIDPATQFAGGGTSLTVTIPRGSTSVALPASGAIQMGTVAGTINIGLTRLVAMPGNTPVTPVPPAPSVSLPVARSAPVITPNSVVITDRTATGFVVQLDAYSTPRDLTNAVFTFSAGGGGTLQGSTSFTVQLGPQATTWFDSAEGRNFGSRFRLRVPFTLSGDQSVLGGVSVVLGNSVGNSAAVSGR